MSSGISVSIVTRLRAGRPGLNSWQGKRRDLFLFVGPTNPPIQYVPEAFTSEVKGPAHKAGHSLPPSAEVKSAWSYTSIPQYVFVPWCLVKHRTTLPFVSTSDTHSSQWQGKFIDSFIHCCI